MFDYLEEQDQVGGQDAGSGETGCSSRVPRCIPFNPGYLEIALFEDCESDEGLRSEFSAFPTVMTMSPMTVKPILKPIEVRQEDLEACLSMGPCFPRQFRNRLFHLDSEGVLHQG